MADDREAFRNAFRQDSPVARSQARETERNKAVREESSALYKSSIEQINRTGDRDIEKALAR